MSAALPHIPVLEWSALDAAGRRQALARAPQVRDPRLVKTVADIIAAVRGDGDRARADRAP